ncbi:UNVERIFIED_CONTAM: hypothetical protein Sradi_0265000 [Sesamum radiatum]|uniref:Uncharacterized protein n=1 Tax=Sesamum radiatum TaxID=300843 RepID=A0AAW2W448_SESRA
MTQWGAAEAPFVGRNSWGAEGHFTTECSKEQEDGLVSRDTKREYGAPHTHQSFVYVVTRTSTDRVGEDVTGRSLGKTAGCDLWRTCGRLGDAGRHGRANGPRAEMLKDWGLQNCFNGIFLDVWGCSPPSLKSFRGRWPTEI